jgi:hypothetical protein
MRSKTSNIAFDKASLLCAFGSNHLEIARLALADAFLSRCLHSQKTAAAYTKGVPSPMIRRTCCTYCTERRPTETATKENYYHKLKLSQRGTEIGRTVGPQQDPKKSVRIAAAMPRAPARIVFSPVSSFTSVVSRRCKGGTPSARGIEKAHQNVRLHVPENPRWQ